MIDVISMSAHMLAISATYKMLFSLFVCVVVVVELELIIFLLTPTKGVLDLVGECVRPMNV